jgi:uncharacterized protein (DUF885 family)
MKLDRRQFTLGAGASALFATAWSGQAFGKATGDQALAEVTDLIVAGDLALSPAQRTALGLDTGAYATARAMFGPAGKAAGIASERHARDMIVQLEEIDAATLTETGLVRHAVVKDMLQQRLISVPFDIPSVGAPYRLSQQDGAYFSIPDFLDSTHPVETADDAEAYLARLAAFSGVLDEESEAQREEASRGYLAPTWSLDLVAKQMRAQLDVAAKDSGMVGSLARRTAAKKIAGDWAPRAEKLLTDEVYPALQRQLDLVEKLKPGTSAGDGVWRVPRGDEIYSRALRYFTTTEYSAEEIHKTGLQQVAEISAELDGILKKAGFTRGSVGERLNALNTRPDQLFANDDAGRAALIASLNKGLAAMQGKLPQAFATIPTQPLNIRRVPVEIQDGAPNGYYNPASLDGSRPAIYWINLKSTADWPKYQLPALTYHEGVPGHHLHGSLLQQDKDLPLLLKNYWLSAYGEGWALYAEMLADELGGYQGIEKAGALQSWLFRAARLVVDTGLNAKQWSVAQATDYLVKTVAFTRSRSQREIERYCASPGQACSYKIGQNEWVRLRRRAEAELGRKFDLRQFHEILKEGVMPLELLDQRVAAWTRRMKTVA